MNHAAFTIIIPAHNEESVIERCLQTVLSSAPSDHKMQIIVAANGCDDRTVAVAKQAAPDALVLDLPQGSKTAAMNAAHAKAAHFPRIYLDADIQCSYRSLEALAECLREPGAMAASPAIRLDLSRSNALVRSYYKVWQTQPYVTRNMVGSGCFGLSQAGYEHIGDFPAITGDDIWVHSRFSETQRRNIREDANGKPVFFEVSPPRNASAQIRVEARRRLGNREVQELYPSPHSGPSNGAGDLRLAMKAGASIVDVAVYMGIKTLARLRAASSHVRDRKIVWERDLTAREL